MRFLCQIYSYTIIISVEFLFNADERQNITVERRNNTVDLQIEILEKFNNEIFSSRLIRSILK